MECVYIDKVSGKNVTDRPVLIYLMAILKSGDKLLVDSISRVDCNIKDWVELVEQLNYKELLFVSLKEAIDTPIVKAHKDFFSKELKVYELDFDENMMILCENLM